MLTVIDNYDSFTYNLVQYLWELGAELQVFRNDEKTVDEVIAKTQIVFSSVQVPAVLMKQVSVLNLFVPAAFIRFHALECA